LRSSIVPTIAGTAILVVLLGVYLIPGVRTLLERFAITVLAIVVEALPFLVVGSVLSAVIHMYVSEEWIARIIPRNSILGVLAASVLGAALPVCDCATVPIVRRLVSKGVPLHVAITFMLAVPILNPLVIFSTFFAFYQFPQFIAYRLGFGLAVAVATGVIVSFLNGEKQIRVIDAITSATETNHRHDHSHGQVSGGIASHVLAVAEHAADDLHDIGRYFMVGVILSGIVQVTIPRASLYAIGHDPFLSIIVMVAAAYILSVCSQADAFIARAFMSQFSPGSLVAFLIFGPMIDLKNTIMLSTTFRPRFILFLIGVIAVASIVAGYLVNVHMG
jgi:hypothetical protein